jgi:hypothetical protein
MVDALSRARRLLRPGGFVLDVHPTTEAPHLEVGSGIWTGDLDADDARRRHAAADAAVAAVVGLGMFAVEGTEEFSFRRYADSMAELQAYVASKWTDAHIDPGALDRTVEALRAHGTGLLWLREQARATKLQPLVAAGWRPPHNSD